MNTYDWLTTQDIQDTVHFDLVEVSFKDGAHKEFFVNPAHTRTSTGDAVLVEVQGGGYDIGRISLSGELVRLQMKKKRAERRTQFQQVIRKANDRDVERLIELRQTERDTMIKGRAIARTLDLDMKIGDVEFQGDGRKVTFYYTADGRVDFRELIRHYAKEFKVKIEMRQIGARQESSRVGGIGTCGRELCCSTWLADFKSVSTAAARYQNLAINQAKLSGQCGRLKCCLNYELDAYIDALEAFPDKADKLHTLNGTAHLLKTDVFKGVMVYVCDDGPDRGKFYTLDIQQVKHVQAMNKRGEKPNSLKELDVKAMALAAGTVEEFVDYSDVTGAFELSEEKRRRKKKKKGGIGTTASAPSASAPARPGREDRRGRGDRNRRPEAGDRPDKPIGERPERPQQGQRPPRQEALSAADVLSNISKDPSLKGTVQIPTASDEARGNDKNQQPRRNDRNQRPPRPQQPPQSQQPRGPQDAPPADNKGGDSRPKEQRHRDRRYRPDRKKKNNTDE